MNKELENIEILSKQVRHLYISGKIKTFKDLLLKVGYSNDYVLKTYFPKELNRTVKLPDVNEFMSDRLIEKSTELWLKENPPYELNSKESLNGGHGVSDLLTEDSNKLTKEDWHSYEESINCKAKLFWHQKKAAFEIEEQVVKKDARAVLLIADAGLGKTFILGEAISKLQQLNYHAGSVSPWPYIYITKASVVEQTKRVLEKEFGLKHPSQIFVTNIDSLRSKAGELWVDEKLIVEYGEEHWVWQWRDFVHPTCIVWDECQSLKNSTSEQHQIAASLNDFILAHPEKKILQIFSSATPFTRVSEAKCFSVATQVITNKGSIVKTKLTNELWPAFSKAVASPADPIEHSPSAVDRLMDILEPYVVRIKGVHPQFHAHNQIKMINFSTEEGAKFYNDAVVRYQEKVAKAEANENLTSAQINVIGLVALLQYKIAAESNPDRIKFLADSMYNDVASGKAAVCAFNYKITGVKLMQYLNINCGVPRDLVSIIWGGGSKEPTKKQKAKAIIESDKDLFEALTKAGITLEDLNLDDVEAKLEADELDPALRLGTQSLKNRQYEIDKFQRGETLYCFYTFRAGGVGLSLHHTDEQTDEKVGRTKAGYAVVEDISKIPTRQRVTYVAPTWSAIEMVQGLGRVPRLTSLSDTEQYLVFFNGTVEEKVAEVVSWKLRCLRKITRQKLNSWEGIIIGNFAIDDIKKEVSEVETKTDGELLSESEDE